MRKHLYDIMYKQRDSGGSKLQKDSNSGSNSRQWIGGWWGCEVQRLQRDQVSLRTSLPAEKIAEASVPNTRLGAKTHTHTHTLLIWPTVDYEALVAAISPFPSPHCPPVVPSSLAEVRGAKRGECALQVSERASASVYELSETSRITSRTFTDLPA